MSRLPHAVHNKLNSLKIKSHIPKCIINFRQFSVLQSFVWGYIDKRSMLFVTSNCSNAGKLDTPLLRNIDSQTKISIVDIMLLRIIWK